MTIQQMEYVVALDTYRHFVTAAEKCFVTQPTLTMQLKKLEDEIGIAIFDRKKNPLEPTKAGETIILKARAILREVSQMKEMINTEKEDVSGEFRIGVIPTIAPYLIPLFVRKFTEDYPKTHLIIQELRSEEIINGLNKDQLDIGLLVTPLEESNLREVKLYQEPFAAYVSNDHPLAKKKTINVDELSSAADLWLLDQGHCFRNQVLNLCKHPRKNKIQFESGSMETLKNLIKHHKGYTLIPSLALSQTDPHVRHFKGKIPAREVSLVVHNGFAKEKLIEVLRSEILSVIPESFVKNEHYIRVKWR